MEFVSETINPAVKAPLFSYEMSKRRKRREEVFENSFVLEFWNVLDVEIEWLQVAKNINQQHNFSEIYFYKN
jgi:hypothetical protein